jgi:hypothetical protein
MNEATMNLPNRDDVAQTWSESEAFERATELYHHLVTARTPDDAARVVVEPEASFFRPATELQLAGLTMLGGRTVGKPQGVVLSLACFTIDHLLWGWTALVNAQPRVASTLSRSAVEATIFTIAAAEDYERFEKVWTTPKGTGGALLRTLRTTPSDVRVFLENLWKLVLPFGHASVNPVMAPRGRFLDGGTEGTGISFAGQYAGPMDAGVLASLADVYAFASVVAVEAMNLTLPPFFECRGRWRRGYDDLRNACYTPKPVPRHLEPYVELFESRKSEGGSA